MPIWKITTKGPVQVTETKLKQEHILEEHREDWSVAIPGVLGEPLLIIGRQVMIPDGGDRIKRRYLDQWLHALNAHGRFGHWRAAVSHQPGDIQDILLRAAAVPGAAQ